MTLCKPLRGLWLALQFLTRVTTPCVNDFSPAEFSRSAIWFPLVGLFIGIAVAVVAHFATFAGVLLAPALGVLTWAWLTGALHLDGLADLTDALAASHRDQQKFFQVLADPHIGVFGVVSIVLVLILKVAGLAQLAGHSPTALALIPAWARLGPLAWSRWLRPLKPGQAERFAWNLHTGWIVAWTLVLLVASLSTAPILCIAPLVIAAWGVWLHRRIGGVTGDCLGAGVELTEVAVLMALAATASSH